MSFDAWGARRNGDDWSALTAFQLGSVLKLTGFEKPVTTRGYTGHEMVDDFGIIHMNGRIYDSRIGRFLQADPFIQAASNTQSYNRYSYVMNNPLNATDPSGYFSLREFVGVIVAVGLCIYAQCSGATEALTWAGIGAAAGAAQAAADGGNILLGAFTGFFAGGLGAIGGWGGFLASGAFGGAMTYAMGGKFGHGFISAGLGSLIPTTKNFMADLAIRSVVGGTVSEITGGKFANGAATAAFSYAMRWAAQKYGPGGGVKSKRGGNGSSENLSSKQEEALNLLRAEAENLLNDIAQKRDAAYASGDIALGMELSDAWFSLVNAKVTFSNGNYLIETTTKLMPSKFGYSVTSVNFDVNAGNVLDMYENGSIAIKSKGYFVDIPSGPQGVRELLAHEVRHGTVFNVMDASNRVLPQKIREHDADAFIRKIYP